MSSPRRRKLSARRSIRTFFSRQTLAFLLVASILVVGAPLDRWRYLSTTAYAATDVPQSFTINPADDYTAFVVTKAADTNDGTCDADCSLREAIAAANADAGAETITFNIPGIGVQSIQVGGDGANVANGLGALPIITGAVTIDGYSQTGASANTAASGSSNAVLLIQLEGSAIGGIGSGLYGLEFASTASGSTVRGLVINRFNTGIYLDPGSNNNIIEGNFLGTSSTGNVALPNSSGVEIDSGTGNTIGGTTPAARNVISSNTSNGVNLQGNSTIVQGNLIGVGADGTTALGNASGSISGAGVLIVASNNQIGGTTGTTAGDCTGACNVIANNSNDGVRVPPGRTSNRILANSIYNNGALGIELFDASAGVTPNDGGTPPDTDTGANNLQNFPEFTSAITDSGTTAINGTLNSTPNSTFRIEFFANTACDSSGNGEGRTYIGSTDVTEADGDGSYSITFSPASPVTIGQFVTATATDTTTNDTSEFSACASVQAPSDTTAPTVTIDQASGQADPTNASPINFTVVFSESVNNFATGDVTLSGTAGATTATVTGSGTTYNVAVSGMTSNGTVIATINAGVATDGASNSNAASTSTDNTVQYDTIAPTVTSIDDGDADNLVAVNATLNYTITFNEDIDASTVDASDFDNAGSAAITIGTITETTPTSGIFTVEVTPTSAGTIILRIPTTATITDVAGNALNTATAITDGDTVNVDATAPTATINRAAGQANSTSTSPVNFAVVFSEAVLGFDSSDIQVSGTAGATTAVVTGSGTTYNVAVSGMMTNGTVTISFAPDVATDTAGNGNAAPTVIDDSVNFSDPGAFSSFVVTKTADTNDGTCDADCSLREAITAANSDSGAETITFAPDVTGTITLLTALPDLSTDMTITGPGANLITVQRDSDPLTPLFRIFTITSGVVVEISGLTISGGKIAEAGGGIYNDDGELTVRNSVVTNNSATTSSGTGGGISSDGGSLTISHSTISGNTSGCDGGGISAYFANTVQIEYSTISGNNATLGGGGVYVLISSLDITYSTVSGNTAIEEGGGLYNAGTLTLTNSTVSGNSSNSDGGGIYNDAFGDATLTSVTITNNHADSDNNTSGTGGGIYNDSTDLLLRNTIVARNFKGSGIPTPATPDDIQGIAVNSTSSFNLIGTGGAGGLTSGGANKNQVGVSNPGLGPLQNNGGPTQTHALQTGSPAIDAGSSFDLTFEQRGSNRTVDTAAANADDGTDIGAVESGNQSPINSVPGAQVTNEDTDLVFSFDNGNRISISDNDAGNNPVQVTLTATNGTISLSTLEDLIFSTGGGFNDQTMTFTGTISDINSALNGLTFTPAPNFNGLATLQITTNDLGNTGEGGPQSSTSTINITVNAINDAPVANNDNYSVNEDANLSVPAPGVLTNDTDDSPTITATLVSGPAHASSFTLNSNGSFTYTPVANYNGPDSFTYKVGDGSLSSNTATVNLTVNPVNDAPVAGGDSYSTSQNTALNVAAPGVLGNDTDIDNVNLTANLIVNVTHGTLTLNSNGSFTYTPASGFSGTDSFTYKASDGNLSSNTATVTITINPGGTLAFSSATYTVTESGATTTITVNRTGGSTGTTTVQYATSDGTATAGQDYTTSSGTLTFANGETSKSFNVLITNDALNEASETVNLTLSSVTGTGSLGTPSTAVLTITDDDPAPSLSINDRTVTEGTSGTVNAVFTVTLSAASSQTITLNYATADGTATAGSDYQATSGTLTFAPGDTQKTITVVVNGDTTAETDETFFVNLSAATNATISDNQGLGTIDNAETSFFQFSSPTYSVTEGVNALGSGQVQVTVTRTGDLSSAVTVDYETQDGSATDHGDYNTARGTLRFAAGQTSALFFVEINEDAYLEGAEDFQVRLTNVTLGVGLGTPNTALVTIIDNDNAPPTSNPTDDIDEFVRQLYHDFLDREPEAEGFNYWTTILRGCTNDECLNRVRVEIASRFFQEMEFQQTGYFVMRLYKAAYGRFPSYLEFVRDRRQVGMTAQSRQAFVAEFVQRPEFINAYASLNNQQFVDQLFDTANLKPYASERQAQVSQLQGGKTRAQVLADVVEIVEFRTREFNPAFVRMMYFGFLRRDADTQGESYWLNIINVVRPNNYTGMVCAFLNSAEYQQRFSSVRGRFTELSCP